MLAGIERIADLVVAGLNATVLWVFFAVVLAYTAGTPGKPEEIEKQMAENKRRRPQRQLRAVPPS